MSAAPMASVWWAREISRSAISDSTASAARQANTLGARAGYAGDVDAGEGVEAASLFWMLRR